MALAAADYKASFRKTKEFSVRSKVVEVCLSACVRDGFVAALHRANERASSAVVEAVPMIYVQNHRTAR